MTNFINPQSTCKLLNVKIGQDNKHQYSFDNINSQTKFFLSKSISKDFTKLTFIQDGQITVEGSLYSLYNANYLMFQNSGFSNKWFYAFITDMKYVSANTTLIFYELDVFQSWYFDINYHESFILRHHVTDDTIGKNTINENLGYGDYIFEDIEPLQLVDEWWYFLLLTEELGSDDVEDSMYANIYDNILSGCIMYAFDNHEVVKQVLDNYNNQGKIDAILDIYCVPKYAVSEEDIKAGVVTTNTKGTEIFKNYEFENNGLNGYIPKNNKLYCYPYNVIELTNNKGQTAEYKPELFTDYGVCKFVILSSIVNNVTSLCFPINYSTSLEMSTDTNFLNTDSGITIDNFPHCPFVSDLYKNWYAQNSFGNNVQLGLGFGNGLLNIGVGAVTGNPISTVIGIASMAQAIGTHFSQIHKAQVTPNQAKSNGSAVTPLVAHKSFGFYINHKTIKSEYAKIIDDYFTMFRL